MVATSIDLLFDLLSDAIVRTDIHGNILRMNEAAGQMLGMPASLHAGCALTSLMDAGSQQPLVDVLTIVLSPSESVPCVRVQARPGEDGASRPLLVQPIPLLDRLNTIVSVAWVLRPLNEGSERDTPLDTAGNGELSYRRLVEHIPDITWTVAEDGRRVFVSRNVERILGYTPEELYAVGAGVCEMLLHPADVAHVMAAHRALFENGTPYAVECRMRSREGSYRWILDRSDTTYRVNGVRYADGMCTDITERKRRESDLNLFRSLIDQSSDSLFVIQAATGRLLDVNDAACIGLGYSREELLALHVGDILRWMDEEREWHCRVADIQREGPIIAEGQALHRSGVPTWVEINMKHVEVDEFGYMVAVMRDITARKNAEAGLRLSYDMLAKRLDDRMAYVRGVLEQVRSSQVRFVANASHDLRTPLTVVRAELDLLRLSAPAHDPATRIALEKIDAESRRLDRLANNLLLLASFDTGSVEEEAKVVRLDEILLACVADTNTAFSTRSLVWDIHCDVAPEILCVRSELESAIVAVLDNAASFSPQGGIVGVRLLKEGVSEVVITITDAGIGISAKDLPYVFDRFYRSDRSRSTAGHGLGLAIAKTVVEARGGHITIESQEGGGTTVAISLPL